MEDDKKIQLMQKKAEYYFKIQKEVHIILNNRLFLNGKILEMKADFMMIDELLKGEMPVFFLEMFDIEPYEGKRPKKLEGN